MSTELIGPSRVRRLDIRCNVGDAIVANLAIHFVLFFQRRLDGGTLARALADALGAFPVFAGRMALAGGVMRIRCEGRGVPLSSAWSDRTLDEAIQSVAQDGLWLVDPVNGVTARWGLGPLCKVRITHLADDATAIGFSWHHAVGDMQTFMLFIKAWAAAAAEEPFAEPLIVEDRAAHLDERLPVDGVAEPGVRILGVAELARSALYLAREARKQRTMTLYFGDDEIARMRDAFGVRMRLSANDVVCAHVSEALMSADPTVDGRTLAIVVNARKRCGLDPMLVGNPITTLNVDLRRGEAARALAERIRHHVDHFTDSYCDLRINQRFLDAAGAWRAARCVTRAFNPARWNPVITNLSGFGLYRIRFEDTAPCYWTMLMNMPVAGGGAILEGATGRGLVFQMALPPNEFDAMSSPAIQERLHRFRCDGDEVPPLHAKLHD
jgi:hypothetical protein